MNYFLGGKIHFYLLLMVVCLEVFIMFERIDKMLSSQTNRQLPANSLKANWMPQRVRVTCLTKKTKV